MSVEIDGRFLRYRGTVLNRADVSEADIDKGIVIMRSGHQFIIDREVVRAWFGDIYDYANLPNGKEVSE